MLVVCDSPHNDTEHDNDDEKEEVYNDDDCDDPHDEQDSPHNDIGV